MDLFNDVCVSENGRRMKQNGVRFENADRTPNSNLTHFYWLMVQLCSCQGFL